MKIAFFSAKHYEREFFDLACQVKGLDIVYFEEKLSQKTVAMTAGFAAVCVFVNDELDVTCIKHLVQKGVSLIALRCAGFNNVDLEAAKNCGIEVVRVPAYSPHAVAEHAMALLLTLNRKTHKAYNRVREANFSLDGLLGFDLYGKTVAVIGVGKIGRCMITILKGFGCRVLAYDIVEDADYAKQQGFAYVSLDEIYQQADIISLHCPLTPKTKHLIDAASIALMKKGVYLINTGRGALIDSSALVSNLKARQLGGVALDVYEQESEVFFEDHSQDIIEDDTLMRLITFPNVIITSHQGFFTHEALSNIAEVTIKNIHDIFSKGVSENRL